MAEHKATEMIDHVVSRATVREQGADAFRKRHAVEDNPYLPGMDARIEWTDGFMGEKYKPTKPQA